MRSATITLVVVIAALAGFYGGARYQQGRTTPVAATPTVTAGGGTTGGSGTAAGGRSTAGPGGTAGNAGGFGRGAFGQVESVAGDVLTIKDARGQEVKVQLSSTTTFARTGQASRDDLKPGTSVMVTGQRGSDGTVSAAVVTIVPASSSGGGQGG